MQIDAVKKARAYDAIICALELAHAANLNRVVCQDIIAEIYRAAQCGEPWRWGDPADPFDVEREWRAYFVGCGSSLPADDVLDMAYRAARVALWGGPA